MIIQCGKRRLVSFRYGWKIEILKTVKEGDNAGQERWVEDSPAYPATLAAACEALCERVLTDGPDITLDQLPDALKNAASTVRKYMQCARKAA